MGWTKEATSVPKLIHHNVEDKGPVYYQKFEDEKIISQIVGFSEDCYQYFTGLT